MGTNFRKEGFFFNFGIAPIFSDIVDLIFTGIFLIERRVSVV